MIRRLSHSLLAALALASASAFAAEAVAAEPRSAAPDPNRPRVLYRQAEAAFTSGKYDEARKLLLEAWSIRRTYDVAAALGQAELELKLYRDAAEHLDFAVQNFAPMESERALEGTKNDLRTAKSQVVEARIAVDEPKARVAVNGRQLGESPLASGIFLEPGTYAFEATLARDRRVTKQVAMQKGGTYDVDLKIPKAAVVPGSGLGAAPRHESPSYVPPGVAAAVGGVGLITGVGLMIAASSKDNRREDLQSGLASANSCGAGADSPSACSDISDLAWSASHFRTGAYVAFGSALAAGVVTYLLWPSAPRGRAGFLLAPSYSHEARSFDLAAVGRF